MVVKLAASTAVSCLVDLAENMDILCNGYHRSQNAYHFLENAVHKGSQRGRRHTPDALLHTNNHPQPGNYTTMPLTEQPVNNIAAPEAGRAPRRKVR